MSEHPTEPTAPAENLEPTSAAVAGHVGVRLSTDVPVLPTRAWADMDEAWGDRREDDSNDERLLRDKPPHWA